MTSDARMTAGDERNAVQENGERFQAGQTAVASGAAALSLSMPADSPPTSGARTM